MDIFSQFNFSGSIFALVALPFLIIAVIFVFIMVRSGRKVSASRKNWLTTPGRMQMAQVEARRHHDQQGITPHTIR